MWTLQFKLNEVMVRKAGKFLAWFRYGVFLLRTV